MEIRRHRARRLILTALFHQMVGRCPIRMAVEQCSYNPAIQHTRERLVMRFGSPFGDDFIAFNEAAYMKPLFVRGPAAEADTFG